MSDIIGRITVPTVINSAQTFRLTMQHPFGLSVERPVIVHRLGSLDAKQEQRYYVGIGPRKFQFKRPNLNWTEANQLKVFWESIQGPWKAFTYTVLNPDGTTTSVLVTLEQTPQYLRDAVQVGLNFVEVVDPAQAPSYTANSTCVRFTKPGNFGKDLVKTIHFAVLQPYYRDVGRRGGECAPLNRVRVRRARRHQRAVAGNVEGSGAGIHRHEHGRNHAEQRSHGRFDSDPGCRHGHRGSACVWRNLCRVGHLGSVDFVACAGIRVRWSEHAAGLTGRRGASWPDRLQQRGTGRSSKRYRPDESSDEYARWCRHEPARASRDCCDQRPFRFGARHVERRSRRYRRRRIDPHPSLYPTRR
jgi:hypothetical protein